MVLEVAGDQDIRCRSGVLHEARPAPGHDGYAVDEPFWVSGHVHLGQSEDLGRRFCKGEERHLRARLPHSTLPASPEDVLYRIDVERRLLIRVGSR